MLRLTCVAVVGMALLSAGACTRSDELRAKQKAREAGQELKHDLKQAGNEVKKGLEKTKEELHSATSEPDRKRR